MEEIFQQTHQEFIDSEDYLVYLKEIEVYSEKYIKSENI